MKWMIAGVSALALAATPALAQGNGKGHGNGNGNGHGPGADRAGPSSLGNGNGRGNGNGNANRGNGNADRGNGGNGTARRDARPSDRGNGNGNAARVQRDVQGNANGNARRDNRGVGNANSQAQRRETTVRRGDNRDSVRREYDRRVGDYREGSYRERDYRDRDYGGADRYLDRSFYQRTGIIDGCPPGLAKKRNGCNPPGQVKNRTGDYRYRYSNYQPDWWGYGGYDGRYYYDDGYLLRYNGDAVSGFIPLLGGALSVGNQWPGDYGYRRMPAYYQDYYGLGSPGSYRYADNVVYRVNPQTSAITSIAALLTGDQFSVGQRMPAGYDVYNVPYSYRDRYYDTPDAHYRYNDGYVYRVDPTTQLIQAAIELIA
ncbi:hypothetical protein [Aurantiacibacter spongiae]|uniref:RcnB family protein n=1 Tax=Aurantiacibacter spongiae TaxID=2488860 RepID=A0A3N5CS97_9SPHN|nr:hypothetical protein [Aurantiacibacter spongiae]RPF72033.1 hypothetical protein EG799_10715 [Aurantiacibacter spongiae]